MGKNLRAVERAGGRLRRAAFQKTCSPLLDSLPSCRAKGYCRVGGRGVPKISALPLPFDLYSVRDCCAPFFPCVLYFHCAPIEDNYRQNGAGKMQGPDPRDIPFMNAVGLGHGWVARFSPVTSELPTIQAEPEKGMLHSRRPLDRNPVFHCSWSMLRRQSLTSLRETFRCSTVRNRRIKPPESVNNLLIRSGSLFTLLKQSYGRFRIDQVQSTVRARIRSLLDERNRLLRRQRWIESDQFGRKIRHIWRSH